MHEVLLQKKLFEKIIERLSKTFKKVNFIFPFEPSLF